MICRKLTLNKKQFKHSRLGFWILPLLSFFLSKYLGGKTRLPLGQMLNIKASAHHIVSVKKISKKSVA